MVNNKFSLSKTQVMSQYADILIPLNIRDLPDLLTYIVGEELADLRVGECVAVEMGPNATKFYTGIVWRLHDNAPQNLKRVRVISKRLYDTPLLAPQQMRFWEWVAEYYLCSLGDVMRVALPSLISPTGIDQEAFEMAEYQVSEEHYIKLIEGATTDKLRGKQAEAYGEILATDPALITREGRIARRLLSSQMAQLNALRDKGIITITKQPRIIEPVGRIGFQTPTLTPHQSIAVEQLRRGFESHLSALLYGVTGSGKTEVYIDMIGEQLAAGRDVLLLVPEIALTTQLIDRMVRIFGSRVIPYHSKIPARRRTEIFMHLAQSHEGGNFVVGARSSIFVPLNNLGLIIVDEEHDPSYKQSDPAPRYNARDAAHILASLYGAHLLLGSATPSLESWANAITGKFAMARLSERYGAAELPEIILSDTRRAARRHERVGHFNRDLTERLEERLERGEQTLLFQNRRGVAPYVECGECGWVAKCPHCNVSMTLHRAGSMLRCHYCDYSIPLPQRCPTCESSNIKPQGFGTERVEEQIGEMIPTARVTRLDRDTAQTAAALERVVGSFARHESDIMVGTQMIAKGFDFSKVTLVGILNADNMLLNPDFRAEERAYALMTQVAGRAGRRAGVSSEVVIQSSDPRHRIIGFVKEGDYEGMARTLLREREEFFYPPYSRITMITLRQRDQQLLYRSANALGALLRSRFGRRIRGPVPPPIDRLRGEWLLSFMVKIESEASSQRARNALRECFAAWRATRETAEVTMVCDVDPQ